MTGKSQAIRKEFIPNNVVIFRQGSKGKAVAYVCRNFSCRLPTDDPDEMIKELRKN